MRRLVIGGAAAALVAAMAAGTPTGATAAAPTGTHVGTQDRTRPVTDARRQAATAARRLVTTRPTLVKASRHDAFHAGRVISSGSLHYVPYQRTYRGLPVVGGDFVVATDDSGRVVATSVAQTRRTALRTTTPAVAKDRARAVSARRVHHAELGRTRLVVLQRHRSTLAWETTVTGRSHGAPSRQRVYVDARTGGVRYARELVMEGTGNTKWEGSVSFPTTHSGSTYSMTNPNATTLTCQNASGNTTFTGTDDAWGNGNETNRETDCADAMYATEQERLMLSAWDGRNGMNGNGGWVPIRVGLDDVNAYYDGTQVQIGHTQSTGEYIAATDVVAHEFGHGVDDKTPGGISGNGTQEFVADTFGAATEWYANNATDRPDYTVGEQVNLVGNGPIRYMYNPSLAGDSNCYSSSTPTAEVHAAAGPGNHWFYLLAEGTSPTDGQPTSPTCNSSSITGVGIQTAEKVMYNAMLLKTSSSSYLKYRTWTLTAAKNLYPSSCTVFNTVKAAWDAVSVPAQSADPTCTASSGVAVTNPGNKTGTVGTAITPFTLSASGGTSPYTWTATGLPAGLSISSSGTVSGTPTTAGTFSVTATAKDAANATGSTTFTVTITGGTGTACSGQKLGNPGFETGTASPWSASSGVVDNSSSEAAHAGSWKAWLDGYGQTHTDTLSQSVTIPSGCTATFTFWLHIDTAERGTTAYDKLTVKAGSTTLATYSNANAATGYTQRSFNLSSLAGQTVTISFSGAEDSSQQTSFVIDDTAVNLS